MDAELWCEVLKERRYELPRKTIYEGEFLKTGRDYGNFSGIGLATIIGYQAASS